MRKYANHTDQQLWSLVRVNNRGAFEEIYERHWMKLVNKAYKVLGNKDQSQDVVQEVFIDLWTRRKTTMIKSLPAYLRTSVKNKVLNHLRRGAINDRHLAALDKIAFADATEEMVNFNLVKEQYEASLSQLPERCKEIFILSRVENLSAPEIAEKLNISKRTVHKHIHNAIKHLRNNLNDTASVILLLLPLL